MDSVKFKQDYFSQVYYCLTPGKINQSGAYYPIDDVDRKISALEKSIVLANATTASYRVMVDEFRSALQEIFALRGEDELIEKICSPLIDKSS